MLILLLGSLISFAACAPGLIYTNITLPVTTNFDRTSIGQERVETSVRRVRLPLPRARIGAEWSEQAIGEAAREAGLKEIYYVDVKTFSVLAGTWQKRTLEIWGR